AVQREDQSPVRQRGARVCVPERGDQRGRLTRGGRRGAHRDRDRLQGDLEVQDLPDGVRRTGLGERVGRVRVDALDRHRQGRAVGGQVQHHVVERVRRIEVERLGVGRGGGVALAPDVRQAGEVRVEADGVEAARELLRGEVLRQRLKVGKAVV